MTKLPPQALEIERAILGTLILEGNSFNRISNLIKDIDFYSITNQYIFKAISELHNSDMAVDMITVTSQLRKNGHLDKIGGAIEISKLTNEIVSSNHLEHHCRILVEKSMARRLIQVGSTLIQQGYDDTTDVFQLVAESQKSINDVSGGLEKRQTEKAGKVLLRLEQERAIDKGGSLDLGFSSINDQTNGIKKGNLIILGARPGMGKTSFATQIGYQVSERGGKVIIFSLEMTSTELIGRIQSQMANVPKVKSDKKTFNVYEAEKLEKSDALISRMQLYIDDNAAQQVRQIKFKCNKVISEVGQLDLVIVDYLQLCRGSQNGNREQEISEISRGLKELAKDLDCPVIALSQLSRAVETRGNKRPQLSDLRDSGAIEQDADQVWFLYRPKYYDDTLDDDIVELIVSKNRNGSLSTLNFEFNASCTNFVETSKTVMETAQNYDRFFDK
jgi:replicative DNA helicase